MKNQTNRKSIMTAIITATLAIGATSFAADSGNITVQGLVDPVNELTVTSQAGFNALDLTVGATDLTVAVVNEKNNDPAGYTVSLVSANAQAAGSPQARLKGAEDTTAEINYSIKYGVAAAEEVVVLSATGDAVVTDTTAATIEAGADKNLMITFAGSTWRNADTYSDTLTLTIAAK